MTALNTYTGGAMLRFAGATDKGRVRDANEDAFALDAAIGLAVVADGVGGANAGEVASEMATATVARSLRRHLLATAGRSINAVRLSDAQLSAMAHAAMVDAHADILEAAKAEPGRTGMASTLVMLFIHGASAVIGWAGDSSCYLLRKGEPARRLTQHHNLAAALGDDDRKKSALTGAVGDSGDVFMPDLHIIPVLEGDLYLLCSDGLSDELSDETLKSVIAGAGEPLEAMADALLTAANKAGGRDNITVAMVRVDYAPRTDTPPSVTSVPSSGKRPTIAYMPAACLAAGLAFGGLGGWFARGVDKPAVGTAQPQKGPAPLKGAGPVKQAPDRATPGVRRPVVAAKPKVAGDPGSPVPQSEQGASKAAQEPTPLQTKAKRESKRESKPKHDPPADPPSSEGG